jgi:hypothetical protein
MKTTTKAVYPTQTKAPLVRHTCEYVFANDLLPVEHAQFIWEAISDGASCSWGDNNHSMITADRFADMIDDWSNEIVRDCFITRRALTALIKRIRALGTTYVELESQAGE